METRKNVAETPGSLFGSIRVRALAIWNGPHNIETSFGANRFWGWRTLSLEVRSVGTDQVESRSVYADLLDEQQRFAIIRSVYWDGDAIRKAIYGGQKVNLVLPARFVTISVELLSAWLAAFKDLTMQVFPAYEKNDKADIRKLRIELDYVSCIVEKVWATQDPSHSLLNEQWNLIWNQMTEALMHEPMLEQFDEDFWFSHPEVHYDFESYSSQRYTPK